MIIDRHSIHIFYNENICNRTKKSCDYIMEETDIETVSRKKMKPASRYKKWLEVGGGGVPLSDMDGSEALSAISAH